LIDLLRSLGSHERLAAIGVGVVAVSLLLPWYGVSFAGLVRTPLSRPSFVEVAIVVTLAATAYMIYRSERGPAFPRPLHTGTLIALGGAWTIVLVVYRIIDRPDLGIFGDAYGVSLRYGIFVALAGAVLIVVGGLRCRRDEIAAERAASGDRPGSRPERPAASAGPTGP
jgi:hypothetical protein